MDRARQDLVDDFVRRHFTWPGTLHLHRAALGLDILRAPMNVLLSPVLLLAQLSGWVCRRLRLSRAADWLSHRKLLLRTAVSAKVEAAILTDLLQVPLDEGAALRDRAALSRAILASPRFREAIRRRGSISGAEAMAERITGSIAEYTGSRSAVAEVTTALLTLAAGALLFHALTPGMISMAPGVAEAVSSNTAISEFPLGTTMGRAWYGVFPVGPSPALVAATVAVLVVLASVVTAFAGTIADPVQVMLGVHRRRLMRLLVAIDAEIDGLPGKPFIASEHLLVRVFDLWDAALSVFRSLSWMTSHTRKKESESPSAEPNHHSPAQRTARASSAMPTT